MQVLSKSLAFATMVALFAPSAAADGPFINEIYASHSGTDDQEFIELYGEVGTSLSGIVVLIVEGDENSSGFGNVDRAWDLTSFGSMSDNYFVLGNTAVGGDLDIGANNIIENGSETIYVLRTSDVAGVLALVGTDVDPDDNGSTSIPSFGSILDIIALVDGGISGVPPDLAFDGSGHVGPDGTFLPAGIFRDGDYPNSWCSTSFLDFDDVANAAEPRTPGASNSPCASAETAAYCASGTSGSGCQAQIWTSGIPSTAAATGFNLTAGSVEGNKNGIFFFGTNGQQALSWGTSGSFMCVVPPVRRGGTLMGTGATGSCDGLMNQDLSARWTSNPWQNPGSGAVVQAQLWYRDPNNTANARNTSMSNAVEFTVVP